ncbi:hypothetical protein ATE49_04230 [Elizabethkingia miricola]|uniref:Zincin-like metallopeptidase toxin 3 of polymorphic toxin system n=1 Tax=Elizabethkingia miricola TaxID=172045 RepID=A0ABY3NB35_ELIMR|nr:MULTISPECIES: hypothetical protein [Elizabethkingia]OBS12696.1 hypothetical protein ATE49_04230 [Elizabethkingia miricola]TYO84736.1 zincin-like metallopeptidase toxin 3 of polymorphic toxin system [Elizabethkingia miricola]
MKKKILFIPLLGILAMSLSSCRSEDAIVQQTQNKEASKNFAVFTPKKTGETIDYAKGFAYLMQRYDRLRKTNLSGINNKHIIGNLSASTEKNASIFQDAESYVEFNIPSEIIIKENGDKWVVFPKVKGGKVIGLVAAILTQNGTYVKYNVYGEQNEWYKQNASLFQDALDKYKQQIKHLNLSASINPVADYNIPGVTVPGKPKLPEKPDQPGWRPDIEPGGGGCNAHEDCSDPSIDAPGGGGDYSNYETWVSPNFRMKISDQQKYPRFTEMVKGLKSYVQNNSIILEKLIKISGLTKTQVLDRLTTGKGPSINVVPNLKDKNGNIVYGKFVYKDPNSIYMNETYISKLENASIDIDIEASTFLLAVTILHEFVHYGNNVTGSFPAGGKEAGKLFENEVYGVVITEENAADYIISFKNK